MTDLFKEGLVKGTAHSYVGQEAVAAGACAALTQDDFVASHHRGHGHCIAKGAALATDDGRADGPGRPAIASGLGGSMHIADLDLNILGANGIVGAGMRHRHRRGACRTSCAATAPWCVAFFGDGAANEGIFHECLNMAAIWKLPVVFVCENNQYALSTPIEGRPPRSIASRRARAAYWHAGRDGRRQRRARRPRRGAARRSSGRAAASGPTLIEALTYRWGDHSMRANLPRYRTDEEVRGVARARRRSPASSASSMTELGFARAALDAIRAEVEAELDAAIEFAVASAGADPAGPGERGVRAALRAARTEARPAARGAQLRRSAQRGAARRRWSATRASSSWARTSAQDRRHLRGDPRADRQVRRRAGARHADLGGGDRGAARSAPRSRACGRSPRCRSSTSSPT